MNHRLPANYPRTVAVEAFLAAMARLTPAEWSEIMARAQGLDPALGREDVIRGAVVAISVHPMLSEVHFDLLYMPFAVAIPFAGLPQAGLSQG